MTIVNHPCIVRCYGMLEPSPGIVLELVEGNSLFQIIHGERGESYMQVVARSARRAVHAREATHVGIQRGEPYMQPRGEPVGHAGIR
jgi:hypothetical protein